MTDREYERLAVVAEGNGMTLGERCREVLLERVDGCKPSVMEETLPAVTLALRTILLNLDFTGEGRDHHGERNADENLGSGCLAMSRAMHNNN